MPLEQETKIDEVVEKLGKRIAQGYYVAGQRLPQEAAMLNISRGQPIIDIDRWVWADDGTLFEYTHMS